MMLLFTDVSKGLITYNKRENELHIIRFGAELCQIKKSKLL